jgi:hypothetical protein
VKNYCPAEPNISILKLVKKNKKQQQQQQQQKNETKQNQTE